MAGAARTGLAVDDDVGHALAVARLCARVGPHCLAGHLSNDQTLSTIINKCMTLPCSGIQKPSLRRGVFRVSVFRVQNLDPRTLEH